MMLVGQVVSVNGGLGILVALALGAERRCSGDSWTWLCIHTLTDRHTHGHTFTHSRLSVFPIHTSNYARQTRIFTAPP